MRTLPTALPTCGERAAYRIEVYTPAPDGSSSSLDASAYVCGIHVDQAVAAYRAADLNAFRVPLAPDIDRPCGHVHIFPTGTLADPAELPHPYWCARGPLCTQRGVHHSRPLPVATDTATNDVCVWLQQTHHPANGEPMLVVEVIEDDGQPHHTWLSLGQGRVLTYQVRRLLDLSKTRRS
ncbi:hypothetical protein ACGFI9_31875 [Micromonospora sp. NPDC048930]|uniref:hypothetical protein n=1 Tax=Micromonospora sp. NPDC048930 TaxID=3364261 RepID=UPI00371D589D